MATPEPPKSANHTLTTLLPPAVTNPLSSNIASPIITTSAGMVTPQQYQTNQVIQSPPNQVIQSVTPQPQLQLQPQNVAPQNVQQQQQPQIAPSPGPVVQQQQPQLIAQQQQQPQLIAQQQQQQLLPQQQQQQQLLPQLQYTTTQQQQQQQAQQQNQNLVPIHQPQSSMASSSPQNLQSPTAIRSPLPQVQVIQQPMNSAYLQQFYTQHQQITSMLQNAAAVQGSYLHVYHFINFIIFRSSLCDDLIKWVGCPSVRPSVC